MKQNLLYCLRMIHISHDMLERMGWESDLKEMVKDIFKKYKEKLVTETYKRNDIVNLEKILVCISMFDKEEFYIKGSRLLK